VVVLAFNPAAAAAGRLDVLIERGAL